jgi:DHA1 family bicyclomycin/chloramphenicol resistance-like MFS transporter
MSLVMSSQKKSLGSTAALLGALQLSVSSSASPLAALVLQHGQVAWAALLVGSTLLVCLLTAVSVRDVPTSFSMAAH